MAIKKLYKNKIAIAVLLAAALALAIALFTIIFHPADDLELQIRGNIIQVVEDGAGQVVRIAVLDKNKGTALLDISSARVVKSGGSFPRRLLAAGMSVSAALAEEAGDPCVTAARAIVVLVH